MFAGETKRQCVPIFQKCDNRANCANGFDEEDCATSDVQARRRPPQQATSVAPQCCLSLLDQKEALLKIPPTDPLGT